MKKLLLLLSCVGAVNFANAFPTAVTGDVLSDFSNDTARHDIAHNIPLRKQANFYHLLRLSSAMEDKEVDCELPWDTNSQNYKLCQFTYKVYTIIYNNLSTKK